MQCETVFECLAKVHILLLAFAFSGCATGGIEKPAYAVDRKDGDFEVRAYPTQVVAETLVEGTLEEAGNAGFRILFRYISGGNRTKTKINMTAPVGQEQSEGEKIAMTAPVGQQAASNQWAVTFMMPSSYSMEALPEPVDDRVRLRAVPAARMAAVRYSGWWSKKRYDLNLGRLREWIIRQQLEVSGEPVWARYNPPFTPWFLRRNEILMPLTADGEDAATKINDD